MSSDSDDENVVRYGTPLEPYEEDELPTKRKYQQPADQYAVDEHGRRRFHGAFTGGFSAGFGNTVGSQEGWTPSTFKSSRSEKAQISSQKAEDFMDEEDRSEYGIAPRRMQTHSEFSGQKRGRPQGFHDGPIPGEPVLSQLLHPVHETAAVKILKSMGWRPGQGAGDRVTKKQKRKAKEEQKVYGCYVPPELRQKTDSNSDSSDSEVDYDTLFAPDDYEPYILNRKSDRFGLGYSGLSRHSVLGNLVSEYGSDDRRSRLVMTDKGKKVSIRGQAFGVGAFEADDEDIYATEDMSHYDYVLGGPTPEKEKPKVKHDALGHVLEGFTRATQPFPSAPSHPPPALPRDYTPAPAAPRRTRFQHTDAAPRDQGLGRHELTADARGALLGETPLSKHNSPENAPSTSQDQNELIARITGQTIDFSSSTSQNLNSTVQNPTSTMQNPTSTVQNPTSQLKIIDLSQPNETPDYISIKDSGKEIKNVFKPFASNPLKQKRYENFLENNTLEQDSTMDRLSEWERERELTEFEQAAKLYKPLTGIMGDRFTHATQPDDATNPLLAVAKSSTNYGLATAEQIEAAAKGLYGVMTRTKADWRPESIVCKRFNVPEPGVTRLEQKKDDKPKVSYSIFSYLESSIHDKESFTKEQTKFSGSKSLQRDTPKIVQNETKNPQNETKNTQNEAKNTQNVPKNNEFPRKLEMPESNKRMTVAELFLKESEKQEERGQEVTETIDQFDKMDLYQSIFLSDSEEEIDQIGSAETDYADKPKNVLRNNSPPRGIFADIDFDEINAWRRNTTDKKDADKNSKEGTANKELHNLPTEEKTTNSTNMDIEETYGPKIPENIQKRLESDSFNSQSQLGSNSLKEPQKEFKSDSNKNNYLIEVDSSSSDSWVDANEVKNKKSKKKSKHKKHKVKSKHKNKKSKHKKKDR